MTDNLDGTYTYKYSTQWDGNITMYVLFYTQFGVYTEFFDNTAYTGTIAVTRVYSQINQDFITGLVTPTQADSVSANLFFRVKAPTSGTINFYIPTDDSALIYIDNVLKGTSTTATPLNFNIQMDKNKFYEFKIQWKETTGSANIYLYWAYTGQAQVIIPSEYLYYPYHLSQTVFQLKSVCPTGYTGSDAANPNR